MTSTLRKTRASAPTEVAISVDPTPITEEVIIEVPATAVDAEGRSEDSEPMLKLNRGTSDTSYPCGTCLRLRGQKNSLGEEEEIPRKDDHSLQQGEAS